MPVYRASGSFNCGTSSPGLQACVDPVHGAFRPKLIWLLPLYTGSANNCYWHRGFVAEDAEQNLTQWALGIRSGDSQSSAAVRVARYTDRAWVQVISSGLGCDGTVSIGDTGFTPSVTTVNSPVDVHWVALGGDVEEAVCVAIDITSGDADGTVPVEVGFAPDVVIAATPAVSANNNSTATGNSSACFGWATRADSQGVSYAQRRVHGADPTTNWSSSDAGLFQSLTSTVGWTATVGAWNADGVDLSITGTPGLSSQVLYLVLARGGEWRTVTATGDGEATQLVPVTGVDPVAVMAQSWGRAPSASVVDGDILSSFGIAAAGGQASEWGSDADAVGTTQADGTYTTDSLIYLGTVNAPATVQYEAVASFVREGLELAADPVDSVGVELQFLVVGDEAAEEGNYSLAVDPSEVVIDARPVTLVGPNTVYTLEVEPTALTITPSDVSLVPPEESVVAHLVMLTPNEGEYDLAETIRGGPTCELWLLSAISGGLNDEIELADLTQLSTDGTGYSPRTLDGDSATTTAGDPTVLEWPAEEFTLDVSAGTVTHIAIVNPTSGRIRHIGALMPAYVPNGTSKLIVPPRVAFS